MVRQHTGPQPQAPSNLPTDRWEKRIILCSLTGCLWLCVLTSWYLTALGLHVPQEVYYLGMASFGALSTLLIPTALHK